MILSFKYRIKDARTARILEKRARAVNFVWNYCCEIQRKVQSNRRLGDGRYWPTIYDLHKLTSGTSAELGIPATTINEICRQFDASRQAHRGCPRFRASRGARKALGWIPFKAEGISFGDDAITFYKRVFRIWKTRDLGGPIKTGCFTEDARGRWYVVFQCEVADQLQTGAGRVGVDLGLKTLATLSNGETVPALRHYRKYEAALGIAQRAHNKRRVRALNARIANARRHHLHEQSAKIARENALIVVGNVSPSQMIKTKMAKSVLDAGWATFKHQLAYKASRHGAVFIEVNEAFTSQACSCCGSIPDSSPKGIGALGVRRWECSDCGAVHDRDVNAAQNILRVGLECQPPLWKSPREGEGIKCARGGNRSPHRRGQLSA